MTSVIAHIKDRTLDALLARMTAPERYALASRLLAEMPAADRQRLLANSPGFITFARAFLLAAGRCRPTG